MEFSSASQAALDEVSQAFVASGLSISDYIVTLLKSPNLDNVMIPYFPYFPFYFLPLLSLSYLIPFLSSLFQCCQTLTYTLTHKACLTPSTPFLFLPSSFRCLFITQCSITISSLTAYLVDTFTSIKTIAEVLYSLVRSLYKIQFICFFLSL